MPNWEACGTLLIEGLSAVPKVMGIVNVTPDSFSDGGSSFATEAAVEHALHLVEQGADILDIGGESTCPGAEIIPIDEELRRVIPVIRGIRDHTSVPISIDTSKGKVARRAIEAGATIVNDVAALQGDAEIGPVVAQSGAAVVLMHMQGNPRTMQDDPRYDNVLTEIHDFLSERIQFAESLGIPRDQIAIDPGIGFGKTHEHNMTLLQHLPEFADLGCVMLVGVSRKGFLKQITGRSMAERTTSSVVCSLAACQAGAKIVRVHDVGPMADAIKVWTAIHGWGTTR